ncbi:plasmid pRiA4b ORF-3 family protein [Aureibacter tunicatorum]|uniref:Plasmid pRiA4b Orf3-like domain-containing protein n=1 Tax=Aureibacter tunicatorum TaxID=866807 RepID=A0AAE3XKD5_9BACT|nr:plasmid pRiA4b ORF-3 family protein [Aureibacter tunicatorum]MDR6238130.1 hypothetical protein [Aureibacter tunicatorum]BDD03163.1 hypothetical protein AUTU_06460 [Aureibacter tunicatorum]
MAVELKITLNDMSPKVERWVTVPSDFNFEELHLVIQGAMGWKNAHLYTFNEEGREDLIKIGVIIDEDWAENYRDARHIYLLDELDKIGKKYVYNYDLKDNWLHKVELLHINDMEPDYPVCTKGTGSCPPEDCGGPKAYGELLKRAKKESLTDEDRSILGLKPEENWSPKPFDIDELNDYILYFFRNRYEV